MTVNSESKEFNIVGAWLEFEQHRKELERLVKELELSNFNLTFGSKTQAEFQMKLRQARILLDKVTDLINTPAKKEDATVV